MQLFEGRFLRGTACVLALLLTVPLTRNADAQSNGATPPVAGQPVQPEPSQASQPQGQPVGTATAPVIRSTGDPASAPAGAAIAPSRQRRSRSYALRIGLIIGAAVAVGVVVAASRGSSSRPN